MTGYWMRFHDEITPIGKLSTIGLPLRKNVAASSRRGLELEASARPTRWLSGSVTANASANRIRAYTDDATGQTYHDVAPLLTPRLQFSHDISLRATRWLSAGAIGRYASRSFLANTADARFVAPASYVADLSATLGSQRCNVLLQLDNALDRRVYPGGYTDGSKSYYYVLAGRHVVATARWNF
jgi:iron complex outermembrane receptor protein